MIIRDITIDKFGILHAQHVPTLAPGITVFVGENEAGKSTCLNFFRAMLFGYARQRRSIDYLTDVKSVSGGSLLLESETRGTVRLTRRPGPHGGPFTLTNQDGSPRPDSDLAVLLRGCTPDLYDKVFAFSLGELMHFGSLTDERIRHALHGAAFGTGLRSPGQVIKELDDDMRRIFAPRASTPKINRLLQEFDDIAAAIKDRGDEVERFTLLRTALEGTEKELAESVSKRKALEEQRRTQERRVALRRRWQIVRESRDALAASPEVQGIFTEDGRERLDLLADRLEERRQVVSAARLALERAKKNIAAYVFDPALAEAAQPLLVLAERKERLREATSKLAAIAVEQGSLLRDITSIIDDLGPGWGRDDIDNCDISLAIHEQCGSLGSAVLVEEQEARQAARELARLERERAAAEIALEEAHASLAALASGEDYSASFDSQSFERLQQLFLRASDVHDKIGSLARAAVSAERSLEEAIRMVSPGWTLQDLEQVTLSAGERECIAAQAQSVLVAASHVRDCSAKVQEAQLLHEAAAACYAARCAVIQSLGFTVPDKDLSAALEYVDEEKQVLEVGDQLLRRAQTANKAIESARSQYESALAQRVTLRALAEGSSREGFLPAMVFIVVAAMLAMTGVGTGLYSWLADAEQRILLSVFGGIASGIFLAATGFFFILNKERASSETPSTVLGMKLLEQLEETLKTAQETIAINEVILQNIIAEAPDIFSTFKSATEFLDQGEALLLHRRERLIILERELGDYGRESAIAQTTEERLHVAEEELQCAQQEQKSAVSVWSAFLAEQLLPLTTRPEDASFLVERIEMARTRRSAWQGRIVEQQAAREHLTQCLHFARKVPGLADRLASLPEPDSHLAPDPGPWLDTVKAFLSEYKIVENERTRLQGVVDMRQVRAKELAGLMASARNAWEAAEAAHAAALSEWQSWLEGMLLPRTLSLETARLALQSIGRAKTALEIIRRLDSQAVAVRNEIESFVKDLTPFAALLPDHSGAGCLREIAEKKLVDIAEPHILSRLFSLLEELVEGAGSAREVAAAYRARKEELPRLADSVSLAEAHAASVEGEIRTLLSEARCDSVEHYRSAHEVWLRRMRALSTWKSVQAAFEREARESGEQAEELEKTFLSRGSDDETALLAEKERELAQALSDERDIVEKKGGLDARMAGLMNEQALSVLLVRRENILGEFITLVKEYSRCALAREMLLTAKGHFEAERKTGVARHAGELFARITNGEYSGIVVSLEDETVSAVAKNGCVKDPETELSRGTREQLYLSLRLAYVLDHGAQAEKLPVVMDDILVNFDEARAASAAAVLASFAEHHQIFYFTCHAPTADILLRAAPQSLRYTLHKGTFRLT